jgi:Tfp pilus assembly protein PilX
MKLANAAKRPLFPQGGRDKGVVLVVGLMFIMVLAAVGSVAYLTTSGDLMVASNYRQHTEAGFAAEAGLNEAKARLGLDSSDTFLISNTVSPGVNPATWSAYIVRGAFSITDDPTYNAFFTNSTLTSSQSDHDYLVRIRYKRERDAELYGHSTANPHYTDNDGTLSSAPNTIKPANNPGNVLHIGGNGQETLPAGAFNPTTAVYLITAYSRSGPNGAIVSREIEVAQAPGGTIDLLGAFYNEADMSFGKGKVYISSVDGAKASTGAPDTRGRGKWCANPNPVTIPALYTHGAYTQSGAAATIQAPAGQQAVVQFGTEDLGVVALFNKWAPKATVLGGSHPNPMGTQANPGVWLKNGDFNQTGGTGNGVLLVSGDLITGGNFYFHGLVVVLGKVRMQGTSRIHGAVISLSEQDDANMGGTPGIFYNSCDVQMALDALGSDGNVTLAWRDLDLIFEDY